MKLFGFEKEKLCTGPAGRELAPKMLYNGAVLLCTPVRRSLKTGIFIITRPLFFSKNDGAITFKIGASKILETLSSVIMETF